jgi:hypothetical protein
MAGHFCQGALLTRNRTARLRSVRGDQRYSSVAAPCDCRCEAAVIINSHGKWIGASMAIIKSSNRPPRARLMRMAAFRRVYRGILRRQSAFINCKLTAGETEIMQLVLPLRSWMGRVYHTDNYSRQRACPYWAYRFELCDPARSSCARCARANGRIQKRTGARVHGAARQ